MAGSPTETEMTTPTFRKMKTPTLTMTLDGATAEAAAMMMKIRLRTTRTMSRSQEQPSGGVATLPPRLGQRLLEFRQRVLALAPEADRGGVRPAFDERLPGFAAGL